MSPAVCHQRISSSRCNRKGGVGNIHSDTLTKSCQPADNRPLYILQCCLVSVCVDVQPVRATFGHQPPFSPPPTPTPITTRHYHQPLTPVATPTTAPCQSYSTSLPANPGYTSTPMDSARSASQRVSSLHMHVCDDTRSRRHTAAAAGGTQQQEEACSSSRGYSMPPDAPEQCRRANVVKMHHTSSDETRSWCMHTHTHTHT